METVTPRPRPTISDVAVAAGVSSATVSRVLNGGHWVSEKARAAVEEAVRSTGYTANHSARSLVTGKANSFAFLLAEDTALLFSDPTFSNLLRGATQALARRSMTLVLLVAGSEPERDSARRYLASGHVDGVMLISSHESDRLIETLTAAGVPTVVCGVPLGREAEAAWVAVDEAGSAKEMVRYLRSRGHRRIALLAGPQDTSGGLFRLQGFREEMGPDFDPDLVEIGDWGLRSGVAGMSRILARGKPVDAVFAASDAMAAGAIRALRQAGLRVPDDVAVAGFDDSGLAAELDPQLTTMRQPWADLSEQMVTLLCELTSGETPRHVTLPTTLVVRDSA
ncbi:LacI family DNA-binding transcriptional regulator [Tessaracoccus lapidicaptus]|uniref:LacI family DNA-binding transcriptional regulator n=1 Tax=Tessaracoccus lapidicaptus TaxID=1427523 RepID=UPI00333F0922